MIRYFVYFQEILSKKRLCMHGNGTAQNRPNNNKNKLNNINKFFLAEATTTRERNAKHEHRTVYPKNRTFKRKNTYPNTQISKTKRLSYFLPIQDSIISFFRNLSSCQPPLRPPYQCTHARSWPASPPGTLRGLRLRSPSTVRTFRMRMFPQVRRYS